MARVIAALGVALMLCTGTASAQVYKCKGPGGTTVYAQQQCGGDAQEVKTRKAPVVDQVAIGQRTESIGKSVDRGYRYSECLNSVGNRVVTPALRRIAGHQQKIAALNANIARANNNQAGATWEAGLRGQIAGIEQAITMERTALEARRAEENTRCATERDNAAAAAAAPAGA